MRDDVRLKMVSADVVDPRSGSTKKATIAFTLSYDSKSPATAQNKDGDDDNPAAAMTQSMQYTMPVMFGFFSLQFPAGLSVYFVLANIIGMGQGWYMRRSMAAENGSANGKARSEKAVEAGDSAAKSSSNGKQPSSKKKKKRRAK